MRLKEHLRNANLPGLALGGGLGLGGVLGLGGGLGAIDRTAVAHRLNQISRCTDYGSSVKRFDVTSKILV